MRALAVGICWSVLLVFRGAPVHAQAPVVDDGRRLAFETAIIKPSDAGGQNVSRIIKPLPGANGYMAQNFPVRLMIALMYKVPLRQVEGGPEWLDRSYFDVEAHADGVHSKEELQAMFRTLLAERFGLKMHTVSREGNVFTLRLDGATKMTPNASGPGMNIPVLPEGNGVYQGRGVPMPYLCWWLGQQVQHDERPVIDRTGLTGTFDFKLAFLPEGTADANPDVLPAELRDRPTLFTALKEQLGLKLVPEKGPISYYVIDQVERPTAN